MIPKIGFGTWKLSGKQCTQMCEAALEIGYRHIDTAVVYGNHRDIAPAIRGWPREELFIVSKIRPTAGPEVIGSVEQILADLEIDHLDLLLYHWPDRSIPFSGTFEAMMEAKRSGLTREIGVSNFTIHHCEDALEVGAEIFTNQVEMHPYLFQTELVEWCQSRGIVITAYSPLARGEILDDPVLQEIGKAHGKSVAQVALRWALQKEMVVIPKASSVERARENFLIQDFELSLEEMKKIASLNRGRRIVEGDWTEFDY